MRYEFNEGLNLKFVFRALKIEDVSIRDDIIHFVQTTYLYVQGIFVPILPIHLHKIFRCKYIKTTVYKIEKLA
jgi:hypothetical protein